MMSDEEIVRTAIHESGHVIVGRQFHVVCVEATIKGKAHVVVSPSGWLRLAASEAHRAVFFLSGIVTERYYYPDGEAYVSKIDEYHLWGLPPYRREKYTRLILEVLQREEVRREIEELSLKLLTEGTVRFK